MKLTPKLKPAPAVLPILGALSYVAIGILIILGLITESIWYGVAILVLVLLLIIMSQTFSWYVSADLDVQSDKIVYTVSEILSTMGNNKTVYTVSRIDECKRSKKGLLLTGDIQKKEPLRNSVAIKELNIRDCTDEAEQLIRGWSA